MDIDHKHNFEERRTSTLVSIVMNCFDSERYLHEAIDSVIAQSITNWELIIWDNCSSDNTADIAKSYNDPRVFYFRSESHTPLGVARNEAMKKCRGQVIGFMDSDDIWFANKLEKQMPLFDNPSVGMVICNTEFFKNGKPIKRQFLRKKPPRGMIFQHLLRENFICFQGILIRRATLDHLDQWFDPRFEMIEDYDFLLRIAVNWNLDYVDEVLAKWRIHSDSLTWTKAARFPEERELMLNKFEQIYPNFHQQYNDERKIIVRKIAYERMRILWQSGEKEEARKIIKPYKSTSIRMWLLSSLTYLPYPFFAVIQRCRGAFGYDFSHSQD